MQCLNHGNGCRSFPVNEDGTSTADNVGKQVEGNVKNLEDQIKEAFMAKGVQKRGLRKSQGKLWMSFKVESAKMKAGFKNEENARQPVQKEKIAVMKEEIKK